MPRTSLYFEQGDIVVADILYSELAGVKRRPVLVVSNSAFNRNSLDVVVCKITSAGKKTGFDIELSNEDLMEGKLKKESFIALDFYTTIYKDCIEGRVGRIKNQKLLEVKRKIKEFFGI